MKHFFFSLILLLMTMVTFSQSTTFTLYVINPTNCPYTYSSTWFDTSGAGNVAWNSVDSTSSPSQDVWSGSVPSNSPTDSMIICIVPAGCCSMVCIRVPVNQQSYTIQLCASPPPITTFSLYVINPTNCPYSLTGTWFNTGGAGSVNWNSVDSTSFTSQDVWSATALTNTSTDSMVICVVPAPPCSCPQVCMKVVINPTAYTIQLCASVGINEIVKENNFSVFPNPAENKINVKVDATLLGSVYKVYDNTGKSVLSGKINSESTIIELSDLSAGIYLFSVGETMKRSFKVIKE